MAGKGRPITNFSNYWHVSGMQILEAAAVRVLSEYDPWRDGMVAVGDFYCTATDYFVAIMYHDGGAALDISEARMSIVQLS